MNPTRRHLVGTALLGLAAANLPPFLATAFASPWSQTSPEAAVDPGVDLRAAYAQARKEGRPLLVLVIPTAPAERHQRGQLLGALLNHGGDEALAVLALFRVVCVLPEQLASAGVVLPQDAWMATLETLPAEPGSAAVRSFGGTPPTLEPPAGEDVWDQQEKAFEAQLDWVRRGLLDLSPDPATLARWARQAEAIDEGRFAAARGAAVAGHPVKGLVGMAPIAVAEVAATVSRQRQQALVEALAEVARDTLVVQRVAGSHWARGSGCGLEIEQSDVQNLVDCGMAHVPAKAVRMLYFWRPEEG